MLVHDRLLTNVAIAKRGLSNVRSCSFCGAAEESTLHALRDCPFAASVWLRLGAVTRDPQFFAFCFEDWLMNNLRGKVCFTSHFDDTGLDWSMVFIVGCWLIWKRRSKGVFESDFKLPVMSAKVIISYSNDMVSSSLSNLVGRPKDQIFVAWSPPMELWIKLNVDGSFTANPYSASCGGVPRNSSGV